MAISFISNSDWDEFSRLMDNAHATFNTKEIIWRRSVAYINRFQEDSQTPTEDITLKVLVSDNWRRSWPVNISSESGLDDEQSVQVYINKNYLRELGFIRSDESFDFDMVRDSFIINGEEYRSFGDSNTSPYGQLGKEVFVVLILKVVDTNTGG